ncbi:MAG TPA: ABC transporter ATP-binding protein [Kiritimatiellia bacterium]|nr:ABC transporter ATP-binding protein [Kiritimatiellia bacterium]HRZ11970.1 ABC transporter ATP-binding protein [Kiritimatiellia bacterium]HSA17224.1 ABC transporter ATP-binding protein [Kiritimatiellia bacterium]
MTADPSTGAMQKQKEWATFLRLFRYARPYVLRLLLGAVCGVLFAGSMAGMLVALKEVFGRIFNPEEVSWARTLLVVGLLPLLAAVRGIGQFASTYLIEWVGNRVVMDLRVQVFNHLQDLSLLFFTRARTGELISRTTNDTAMIERAVSTVLADLIREPFTLVAMVGFAFWLDWKLALIGVVLFPVCIIPVTLFGRRVRRFSREGQQQLADMVSVLQENAGGARVVRAFGLEELERARFLKTARGVLNRLMRVVRARAAVDPIIVFISMLGLGLVLIYARWTRMSVQDLFTFAAALVALYDPAKKISRIHISIQQSAGAADRIFELLDTPVSVRPSPGAVLFAGPVQSIVFGDVAFAYDTEPILRAIRMEVKAGQRIAIVGGSGSGKTTLVGLIPRFYDVTAGRILLNGRDIRDFTLDSLRRQIGMVTQDTFLFNETVARNIAFGKPDATRQEIEQAARRAHAHEFIAELPQGYETMVGERGVRLSGGQCQRLAIARAIVRNPPILILDEATSALDTESERQVQAAIEEIMTERTVFAIAHRLSTIMHADRIVVLDGGLIAEVGTHGELLEKGGLYKRLYDMQFQDTPAA